MATDGSRRAREALDRLKAQGGNRTTLDLSAASVTRLRRISIAVGSDTTRQTIEYVLARETARMAGKIPPTLQEFEDGADHGAEVVGYDPEFVRGVREAAAKCAAHVANCYAVIKSNPDGGDLVESAKAGLGHSLQLQDQILSLIGERVKLKP